MRKDRSFHEKCRRGHDMSDDNVLKNGKYRCCKKCREMSFKYYRSELKYRLPINEFANLYFFKIDQSKKYQ